MILRVPIKVQDVVRRAKVGWAAARCLSAAEPLVVYTAPKTGSTSVEDALATARIPCLKVHFLHARHDARPALQKSRGAPLPHHYHAERALKAYLARPDARRLRVVSMVRDPVARLVSAMFQNPEYRGLAGAQKDAFVRQFETETLPRWRKAQDQLMWFGDELCTTFGLDLLTLGFDRERGAEIYDTPDARILIIKTDALDRHQGMLSDFVGVPLNLGHSNARAGTASSPVYAETRRAVALSQDDLDWIYGSAYVKLLFTDQEIAAFRRRWSAGITQG